MFDGYATDNQQTSYHPEMVLSFPLRGFAVLDGVHRTMMVAGHAHCAVAVPFRTTFFKNDVLQRTNLHAFAAVDALVGGVVLPVVGGVFVEAGINDMAFHPGKTTHGDVGETLPVDQSREVVHQGLFCGLDFLLGSFFRVELESGHPDIGFRHGQAETGRQFPAFL